MEARLCTLFAKRKVQKKGGSRPAKKKNLQKRGHTGEKGAVVAAKGIVRGEGR